MQEHPPTKESQDLCSYVPYKREQLLNEHILTRPAAHACTINISMSISGNCFPEPGKCPGKPLIALPDRPYGPIYWLLR